MREEVEGEGEVDARMEVEIDGGSLSPTVIEVDVPGAAYLNTQLEVVCPNDLEGGQSMDGEIRSWYRMKENIINKKIVYARNVSYGTSS